MHPSHDETVPSSREYEPEEYLGLDNVGGAPSRKQKGLSLNPLQRLIKRNGLLIGIPTLAAAVLTGTLVMLTPQKFSGAFQVLVEPMSGVGKSAQPSVLTPDSTNPSGEVDYVTLVRVLTSPSVLSGIVQKIQTRYPAITLSKLNKNLTVERIEQNPAEKTKILAIGYENPDPKQLLYVLNELAAGYLKFGLEDRKNQIGGGVAFIEQQLPALKGRVGKLEAQLQALQQEYHISDLEGEGAQLAQQSRQLQTQQLEAQRDLAAQKTLAGNLQQQLGGISPQQALKTSSLSENPRYQALLSQLKELEAKIAVESAQFQPENPVLQTLQEQRKNLTDLLAKESQKLVGSAPVPQFQNSMQKSMSQQLIDSLNQAQVLEVRAQALQQANAAVNSQVSQFPAIKRRYSDIQAQLEIAQNTLKQLQTKRESLRVESAQKEVPWRLLAKPDLQRNSLGEPITSSRKGLQKILLGTLGGFLLGLGAAILREKRQDVFFSLEDVQESLPWPVLGVFPFSDKAAAGGGRSLMKGEIDLASPQGFLSLSDAAEGLYTQLRFLGNESAPRALVVSSSSPRDGKTTVLSHLAKSAASMGQRVLVVDANLTMPQVHTWLDVPNFEGLFEVLTKNIDPNQIIQRSPLQSNLFVLSSGQVTPNSRKLLASHQMQHLMSQLHTMFDLVLYDTIALQNQPDASFLALNADGLLLVASVNQTRRAQFFRLMKKFQGGRIPLLGIVANQVRVQELEHSKTKEFEGIDDEFEIFRVPSSPS